MKTALITLLVLLQTPSFSQALNSAQTAQIKNAKQGSVVILENFLSEKIPSLNYTKTVLPGPQFVISDDPEYIRVPEGVVLRERVEPGTVRVYMYNVNGIKEPKIERRILPVIKNLSNQPMHLRMLKSASHAPTANYFLTAKKTLAAFLAAKEEKQLITVAAGSSFTIDPAYEEYIVKYDELAHGIYEFVIDQPGEINILQTDLKTSGAEAVKKNIPLHPVNGKNAGRGTFGVSNYLIRVNDTIGADANSQALILADGKTDPWVTGTEGVLRNASTLAGNYGVMYDIELKWKPNNYKYLALITWNARAGDNKWCGGMANAMEVSGGKFPGGVIQLPADVLRTKGAPEAILIQLFEAENNNAVQTIKLKYSPPGASCLPTPLIFVPVR